MTEEIKQLKESGLDDRIQEEIKMIMLGAKKVEDAWKRAKQRMRVVYCLNVLCLIFQITVLVWRFTRD